MVYAAIYPLTVLVIVCGIRSQIPDGTAVKLNSARDRKVHNLETELSRLRMVHHADRDRRAFLEQEIAHYEALMQGLNLLCKTTQRRRGLPVPTRQELPSPSSNKPTVSGISAHAVTSVITPLGERALAKVTVTYSTTETHDIIWAYNVLGHMVPIRDGDPFSSVRHEANGETFRTSLYIEVSDLARLELLYVKILSEFSEITILFNKASLLSGGNTELTPIKLWKRGPSPEVLVLNTDVNANISTFIETNNDRLLSFVNFIGIDTSVYPNRLLDVKADDTRIHSSTTSTVNGFLWTIILDRSLVNVGGMLSMRLIEQIKHGTVLQVHTGKTLYIIPDKANLAKEPFPPQSLALLPLYKNTGHTVSTKSPIGAIWCYAFGNPAPKSAVIKIEPDGRRHVLKGHVYNIGRYDSALVVLIRNITAQDRQKYACEATSGIKTVAHEIYLNVLK